ncbi:MAG: hypothetical protein OWT27_09585 [Firmicutes bacterium]|nr:hypothetical protein [Bacillota bacterium]
MTFFPYRTVAIGAAVLLALAGGAWYVAGNSHPAPRTRQKDALSPAYVLPHDQPLHRFLVSKDGLFWSGDVALVQSYSMTNASPKVAQVLNRTVESISFSPSQGKVRVTLDAPLARGVSVFVNGKRLTSSRIVKTAEVTVRIGQASARTGDVVPVPGGLAVKPS